MNTCFYAFFLVEAEKIPLMKCCIHFNVNVSGWKAPQEVMWSNLLLRAGLALRSGQVIQWFMKTCLENLQGLHNLCTAFAQPLAAAVCVLKIKVPEIEKGMKIH